MASAGERVDPVRRALCGAAALAAAGAGLGAPAVAGPASAGSPAFPPLKRIRAGLLEMAYAELGPQDGDPVVLLHGWPYDIHSFAAAAPALAALGRRVIVPYLRGFGSTAFRFPESVRNGQPAALAVDLVDLLDALGIGRAVVAGFDWGARTACIAAALWPERVKGLVSVSGYLIGGQAAGAEPLPPEAELQWWYQFYFATERGRIGYEKNRREFARLIWKLASPGQRFDSAAFERSAGALDNPDHVAVVIHNYRWRLGLAPGERRYDPIERRLAARPPISVPTVTLEGDSNGAPHPEPETYASRFTGRYQHRTVAGGIGHDLPREAPEAFVRAIADVSDA